MKRAAYIALAATWLGIVLVCLFSTPNRTGCLSSHDELLIMTHACKSGACTSPIVARVCDKAVVELPK